MLKQEGRVLERVLEKKRVLFREYERNLQSGTELKSALNHAKQAQQDLFVLIGVALLAFALLVILLRQRNPTSLSLTGQLNLVFPEECVAELGALREQLIVKGYPGWVVRLRMAQEILELVLAIYLQINIDNLWLPQKGSRKRNDE